MARSCTQTPPPCLLSPCLWATLLTKRLERCHIPRAHSTESFIPSAFNKHPLSTYYVPGCCRC